MHTILIFIQYFSIILLLFESGYVLVRQKTRLHVYLFLLCFTTLINNVGYLGEMLSHDYNSCMISLKFAYLGKVFIPLSLLLFVLELCDIHPPKKIKYFLFSFHAATFLIVLTCEYHELYYVHPMFSSALLFPCMISDHGIWYNSYMFILLVYVVYGLVLLFKTLRKETDPMHKKRIYLVTAAIGTQSLFFILEMMRIIYGYDMTIAGYTISAVIILIALMKYDLMDTKALASQYIVEELSEPIIVTDRSHSITYLNTPAKKLFPDYQEYPIAIISRIKGACEAHQKLEIDGRIFTPEPSEILYNGMSQGTIFSLIDDTEDIATAQALLRANAEAQNERQRADEANKAKSAFLSNMSHEIRTPMNAIVGMTEILLREKHDAKTREYLCNIQRSGESLLSIINDILDFSKIESGKLDIIEAPYDPHILLNDLKVIFLTRVGEKSLILDYDIDKDLPSTLMGDSLRVRQIIINLMNNAIKFTDEGMVRLSIHVTEKTDKYVKLLVSVRDTGQGIREEDLKKLFQSFSQVNSVKNHSKEGSGLGLSICKNLVNLMGGNISVESTYGEGSTFSFDLIQSLVTEEEAAEFKREQNAEKSFRAPKARVLIVDDNEMNLTVALGLLEPLAMQLDTASNGREAIAKIEENRYDLVFMDHMMPVMDGLEATELLRAHEEEYFKKLPILALSANVQKESVDSFIAAGMNDSVAKPIRMNEICRKLRIYLPEAYIEETEQVSIDDESEAEATDNARDNISDIFNIEGLDMVEALANCGNEKLLRKLLEEYYHLITPKADLIDSLLAEDNIKNYTIEVHALKNTSRMIGAMELSSRFKQLEEYGHASDTGHIRELHEETVSMYRALLPVLEPYCTASSETLQEVSNEEIKEVLSELLEVSQALDLDGADRCLAYINTLKLPPIVKEKLPELSALIADVALDKLPDVINSIISEL